MNILKNKKMRGSLDCCIDKEYCLTILFILLSSIGITLFYFKIAKENELNKLLPRISVILLDEKLINLTPNSEDFSYNESKSYSIYSPKKFAMECFKNIDLASEEWKEIKSFLNLATIKNKEISNTTKIISFSHPAFNNLRCKKFQYQNGVLMFNNKPVYFLTHKYQNYEFEFVNFT